MSLHCTVAFLLLGSIGALPTSTQANSTVLGNSLYLGPSTSKETSIQTITFGVLSTFLAFGSLITAIFHYRAERRRSTSSTRPTEIQEMDDISPPGIEAPTSHSAQGARPITHLSTVSSNIRGKASLSSSVSGPSDTTSSLAPVQSSADKSSSYQSLSNKTGYFEFSAPSVPISRRVDVQLDTVSMVEGSHDKHP